MVRVAVVEETMGASSPPMMERRAHFNLPENCAACKTNLGLQVEFLLVGCSSLTIGYPE